ncbi:MAG: hypothetical protein LBT48_02575 [Prevotellaceae bacterium]|nr:hypothetical protein [Prevotellaceae bacterium]
MKKMLYISVCLLCSCGHDDLPQALRHYAGNISRMVFTQANDTVTLTETPSGWIVNDRREAAENRIADWWYTVQNWRLRPLDTDTTTTRILTANIKRNGVGVHLYKGSAYKPLLHFYIYDDTHTGAIVLHNGNLWSAALPYSIKTITEVCCVASGFWNNVAVCAYSPSDIDTIKILHALRPEASFMLIHENNEWRVTDTHGTQAENQNNELIRRYVTYFRRLDADSIIGTQVAAQDFSHYQRQHAINIKGAKENRTIDLFGIPLDGGGYDSDKCLLFIGETEEWALASWVSFDLLLRNYSDFVNK